MRFILLISFVLLSLGINAQAILNRSYQLSVHEKALGFVGFNTFNICVSQSVTYPSPYGHAGDCIRLLGLNNDGTTRFNKKLGDNGVFNLSKMGNMVLKKKTRDKGMLLVLSGWHCGSGFPSSYYYVSCYALVDSMGNTVFSKTFNVVNFNGGIDTISSNFYFITENSAVSRVDQLSGVKTNSIFSTPLSDNISASSVTSKKQIAISTTNSIFIVDTMGNLINSKPISFESRLIVNTKKDLLFLNKSGTLIEKRDSALQIMYTYSADPDFQINDMNVFNDTIYLALYNFTSKISKVISLDTALNTIQTKSINDTYRAIIGVQKDDKLKIFFNDYAGPVGFFPGLSADNLATTGFASFNSMNDIQFDNDLVISNVANVTCTTAPCCLSYQSYTYVNKITIYNNSPYTVTSFNLNHYFPTFMQGSSMGCISSEYNLTYSKSYSLTINPYQSIDVTLPEFTARIAVGDHFNPVFDPVFTYNVNSPNGKTESNVSNSTYSQTIHFDLTPPQPIDFSELEIFPNPTEKFINFNSIVGLTKYTIHDALGNKIMESGDFSVIDLSTLSVGVYFITVEKQKQKVIKKLLKIVQ